MVFLNKMFNELNNNIDTQRLMIRELGYFLDKAGEASPAEKRVIADLISSIKKRLRLINNAIPLLIEEVTLTPDITSARKQQLESVSFKANTAPVTINKPDKGKFLEELRISEELINKLKKRKYAVKEEGELHKEANAYSRTANKLFLGLSQRLLDKELFKKLSLDLKKSNLNILSMSYVSMMILSICVSFFAGFFIYLFFIFFYLNLELPIMHVYTGEFLLRAVKLLWILLAVPLLTALGFYFYPGSEKSSLGKKIDQELPFVVIHMGSISGSGIEPIEIFKIISSSGEYKYTSKEIKKLLNQINLYGYDLVTALGNVAKSSPSAKLAELLNGLATTLNSGGGLEKFFSERAKTLLLEYRLEREKFIKTAETFMDIYISVVIATPMILLLLLVMISVSGIQVGLGIGEMTFLIIALVSVINLVFLVFLHLKQPSY